MTDQRAEDIDSFVSVFASILILIPFAYVAATFVTPLVRERESGSKEMQFISGVTGFTYWVASWTWDLIMFGIITFSCVVVFVLTNRDEFVGSATKFIGVVVLLLMYGFAALPLSSAMSFAFKTPSFGLICMIGFHFLTGFVLVLADFIMDRVNSTQSFNGTMRNFYRFFPAYCLGQGPTPRSHLFEPLSNPIATRLLPHAANRADTLLLSALDALRLVTSHPPDPRVLGSACAAHPHPTPLPPSMPSEHLALECRRDARVQRLLPTQSHMTVTGNFRYIPVTGFFQLSVRDARARVDVRFGRPTPSVFEYNQLGAPLLYLFLEGLAFGALTLALQKAGSFVALQQMLSLGSPDLPRRPREAPELELQGGASGSASSSTRTLAIGTLEDDSVKAERAAIDGGDNSGQLVLKHLRKEYTGAGGKVAVRDLCLRIQTGECFGFLGVNGAGKSTTFSMLTGATPPTSGDAVLNGMSILSEQDAIRRLVGYCPQHGARVT